MKLCVVVPHYRHVAQFRRFLPQLLDAGLPLIIVDDASPDDAFAELRALVEAANAEITLVRHALNRGKGGAVMTGLEAARDAGFTHAIQIDADGQHDVAGVAGLCDLGARHPHAIICAEPVFDRSISKVRYYGRYLTHALVWLETLSFAIRDSMCGFRLYPVDAVIDLLRNDQVGWRMDFDPELLVRASWAGIPIHYVPVPVRYPEGGASNFNYVRDNAIITWMHIRLVTGMLIRLPRLLARKFRRPSP